MRYFNISENAFEVFPEALLLELPVAKPPVLLLIVHLALLTPAVAAAGGVCHHRDQRDRRVSRIM